MSNRLFAVHVIDGHLIGEDPQHGSHGPLQGFDKDKVYYIDTLTSC